MKMRKTKKNMGYLKGKSRENYRNKKSIFPKIKNKLYEKIFFNFLIYFFKTIKTLK